MKRPTSSTRARALLLAISILSAWPGGIADAQTPSTQVRRVGLLGYSVDPALIEVFRTSMGELGWIEGRNVSYELRCSEARIEALPARASDLIQSKVDVIVASGTPSLRAAKQTTHTVPIVMVGIGSDPTVLGFVQSLARPGGNVTGVASLGVELWGKRLQLFKEVVPKLSKAIYLYNRANPSNLLTEKEIGVAATNAGVNVKGVPAGDPAELERAFALVASESPDALVCVWDAFLQAHAREIADFAIGHRLPILAPIKEYVQAGALMSYGAKLPDQWRRAAQYADKILRGTSPSDLPVEQPLAFELVINRRTAKALEIKIPSITLFQADQIID
jgi:putative ABC transport system substrate-binding protein